MNVDFGDRIRHSSCQIGPTCNLFASWLCCPENLFEISNWTSTIHLKLVFITVYLGEDFQYIWKFCSCGKSIVLAAWEGRLEHQIFVFCVCTCMCIKCQSLTVKSFISEICCIYSFNSSMFCPSFCDWSLACLIFVRICESHIPQLFGWHY